MVINVIKLVKDVSNHLVLPYNIYDMQIFLNI